ncbi:hypothetical protein NGA_0415200, partial [Nannochloropsis gaditana CCMP526]|uniref:uncharacterized protein n=1 Tax=Nannochloropsis gaditana (strain CCMP526) TaxID=1093141 RepID=UPI00029F7EBC
HAPRALPPALGGVLLAGSWPGPEGGREGGREGGKEGGTTGRKPNFECQEVVIAARLQIESMKASVSSSPPSLGSAFLTLAVNTSAAFDTQHPVEAFQVSPQGVQMVWDGLIQDGGGGGFAVHDEVRGWGGREGGREEGRDNGREEEGGEGGGQRRLTTGERESCGDITDVFVSGKTRREVDAALFTLPLAITPDSTPSSLPPSIASSIVRNALPALKDDEDLRAALLGRERGNRWLETRDKKLLSKLADFHLLIYLSNVFG